jgi:hypothetical protein
VWSCDHGLKEVSMRNLIYVSTKGDESGFSGSPNFQLRYPIGERIQFLEV